MTKPIPEMTERQLKRFWARIDVRGPDECWPWTARRTAKGYGCFWIGQKVYSAHRISIAIHVADPLSLCALHRCDNPPCCNPEHLFVGTNADNVMDKVSKGRQSFVPFDRHGSRTKPESRPRGSAHGMSKLTESDIASIRSDPRILRVIAAEFGVSLSNIHLIKARKKWAHI